MKEWLYSDVVKDHFINPRNVLLEDESTFPADGRGLTGNLKCGDQMLILIKVKDDIITDVRWKTYGCASAIASTSMLSEVVKGKTLQAAYNIKPEDIAKSLGGLPENKIHCSVLGDKALRGAVDDYLEKTGRKGLFQDESAVEVCHCLNLTDRDIENAVQQGARTWEDLQNKTKIGTVCGHCKEEASELLHQFCHIYGD
jgi:nitrogen fixation NifU-like protein